MNRCWILLIWRIIQFFSFYCLRWWIPGGQWLLAGYPILLYITGLFANVLWRIVYLHSWERDWCIIFTSYNDLLQFVVKFMLASHNELWSVPSLSIIWGNLHKIGAISSLNVWKNLLLKLPGPGVFFVEKSF